MMVHKNSIKRLVLACCARLDSRSRLLMATLASGLLLGSASHAETSFMQAQGAQPVGQVSLVLGRAYVHSANGVRRQIVPGMPVFARDRILTESNGHVHVQFVDQALVSVRPDSRLDIQQYDYNPDQPASSAIRLNLEEGVTRSISGRGATSARERFRMNTPIAAIGVRGTDFVVSASQTSVRAMVNEGAIVLAPFSSDCVADAFGPCAEGGVELSNGSFAVLEMESGNGAQLVPAAVERDPTMMREEVNQLLANSGTSMAVEATAETAAAAEDKTAGTGVFLENVTSQRVKEQVVAVAAPKPTPQPQPDTKPQPEPQPPIVPEPKPEPPVVVAPVPEPEPEPEPEVPVEPALPDFTPELPFDAIALTERNLVWGRWGVGQGENERITTDYPTARAGRDVTIGNRDYALFRDGDGRMRVDRGLGDISFSLHSAQAYFSSQDGVFVMAVRGGELGLNFNNNQFSTSLDLHHSLTGDVNFSASGLIREGGFFYTSSPTERMSGAVSLDGREAGYFFEKQLEIGGISGITLWDRR